MKIKRGPPRSFAAFIVLFACILIGLTGRLAIEEAVAETSLSGIARIYLPYIIKQAQPVPTATPTITVAPTNTPTPTPTPDIPSAEVRILPNHSHYVDSIDYLHIVGEVQNDTADHLRFVRITANVFNDSHQLIDTKSGYTLLDNLAPGDKTCFHILMQEPSGWSYYEFEAVTYWTDGKPLPNLSIFNHSGSHDPTFGWYEVIGQVRNDHGALIEYVKPIGTLYDNAGTAIGCRHSYVNSTHLDPNQTSSFKILFSGRNYADVASYRLQTDGMIE
jgi:hypothetical protein